MARDYSGMIGKIRIQNYSSAVLRRFYKHFLDMMVWHVVIPGLLWTARVNGELLPKLPYRRVGGKDLLEETFICHLSPC